jgi:DNA-binding LacI/PurR family transcriptional regulator
MMSRRQPLPSAHDVARLAGVSQAAVSRAFTPGASIANDTRERVLEAAQALGYRPNLIARSLIKGRSGIVGVVIGDPRYPFVMAALNALCTRLSQAGRHVLVHTAEGDGTADVHVEELLRYRADAILLIAAHISPALAARCHREGAPVLSFSRPLRPTRGIASICGDNRKGGAAIAEHLLAQGYRRLAVIAGAADTTTGHDREAGFLEHLAARGLGPCTRATGDFRREGALAAARSILSAPDRPDAIFCANDDMALAAIEVARYDFGLAIGRDLGVAGFDDVEQASWRAFDLTTYALSVDRLIEQTVEILLDEPGTEPPALTIVEGALKVRGSTRRD